LLLLEMRLPPSSDETRHSLSVVTLTDNLTAINALIVSRPKTLFSTVVSLLNAPGSFGKAAADQAFVAGTRPCLWWWFFEISGKFPV
jgi:hypothetical protein